MGRLAPAGGASSASGGRVSFDADRDRAAILARIDKAPEPAPVDGLLPCPFCGDAASVREDGEHSTAFVLEHFSKDCPIDDLWDWYPDKQQAVAAWNRRALTTADTSFQSRVQPWMMTCFGAEISADKAERNHRFLEEALELAQALGCPKDDALALVEYVYSRDIGDPPQEVGGVMVTLAALCLANELDMHECGETELARIWTKVEKIRAKQAAKPKGSALPQEWKPAPVSTAEAARVLLEAQAGPNRSAVYEACANRVKVYKFNAVLEALAVEEPGA